MEKYIFNTTKEKMSLMEEGKEIGYITFPLVNNELVRITHTFVDPSKRGEHLGEKLLSKVVEELKKKSQKAILICPYAQHYFSLHPELSYLLSLDEENFRIIRSMEDPLLIMEYAGKDSRYLFSSHKVPGPFGKDEEMVGEWLISPFPKVLDSFNKEIILRDALFQNFVNGDAIPSLQDKSFNELISILLEEAKTDEIRGFHGGTDTLIALKRWGEEDINDEKKHYESLNKIIETAGLNLTIKFYEKEPSTSSLDELEKETLKKRLKN